MVKSNSDKDQVIAAITEVSSRSANAKQIDIFELGNLNDLISKSDAEKIRGEFVKYKTPIRQITNHRKLTAWTENADLIRLNQTVKYVSPDNFLIENEILIFEDTVAIYRLKPDAYYTEITDATFSRQMLQLFNNTWQAGDSLLLSEDGSTLSKQYLPLTASYRNIPVVIYPAKDDGRLEQAFSRLQPGVIEDYVNEVIQKHASDYIDADMIIVYVWNQDNTPCSDVWKVNRNSLSDDSGLLYDAHIYKGYEITTTLGIASGNSSIVLTAEEMLLRELVMKEGLSFIDAADRTKYSARFPIGYVPDESFYSPPRASM